jgi:hypothetical protein
MRMIRAAASSSVLRLPSSWRFSLSGSEPRLFDGVVWTRLESFLINPATISLAAVAAYAALHLQPGHGWASPRSSRAAGRK